MTRMQIADTIAGSGTTLSNPNRETFHGKIWIRTGAPLFIDNCGRSVGPAYSSREGRLRPRRIADPSRKLRGVPRPGQTARGHADRPPEFRDEDLLAEGRARQQRQ